MKGFDIPKIRIVKVDDPLLGLIYYELFIDEKSEGRYPSYDSLIRRIEMMISEMCLEAVPEVKKYD